MTWLELYSQWKDVKPGPRKQQILGQLVNLFEPLILGVIRRYPGLNKTDTADLQQAGRMGVMRAVELFNPLKREAFPPYCLLWVRHCVRRELRVIRGMSTHGATFDFEAFKSHVEVLGDRNPTPEEYLLEVEDRSRWAQWIPEANKVLNAPADKHHNVQRSRHRELVQKINRDAKEKRLAAIKKKPS